MALNLPMVEWGGGRVPAVMLHGFTGSGAAWSQLEPLLGELVTARCPDLPGHRQAPLPAHFEEVVESIGTLLDRRSVLIGYSQGARLALAAAARFPERVSRLVLESGSPGLRRRHDRARRRAEDNALAQLIETEGVESFVDRWERLPLFSGLQALGREQQDGLRSRRVAHSAQGLAAALRVMGQGAQPDLWPALVTLRVPTLLLSGSLDAKYTRLARRMATELPIAWRVAFRGVGHAPHLECPERWAAEVSAFVQTCWNDDFVAMGDA